MSRSRRWAVMGLITLTIFVGELSYSVVVPILPQQAEKLGWSDVEIGLLLGSLALSGLVMAPFVGRLSSRFGARRLFFTGLLVLAAGSALCTVEALYNWILAGRILQGASVAITTAVGMAYIVEIYPAEQRGRAMGIVAGGFAAGSITGPAVGGTLYETMSYSVPFLLIFACAVFLALTSARALPDTRTPREGMHSFRALLAKPRVRLLVLCAALSMGVLGMLEAVVPVHLERSFGTGPAVIGLVFVGAALGQGLASPLAGIVADLRGSSQTMLAGLTLLALTLIAVSVGGSVLAIAVTLFVTGFASSFALVPVLPRIAEVENGTDETSQSTAYALLNFAVDAGMMAGPLLGSLVVSVSNFSVGVLSASAVLFVGAWLNGRTLRVRVPSDM